MATFAAASLSASSLFSSLCDVEKKARLFEIRAMLLPGVDDAFEGGLFPENALGFFAVVPKIRLDGELVQLLDALLLAVDVKDASAKARAALRSG